MTVRMIARRVWLIGLAATLLLVLACGSPGIAKTPRPTATNLPQGQVRGHVLEVVEGEDDKLAGLRLRDSSGKVWTFTAEGDVGLTASHTRLHQVLGQTALITYITREDRLVMVEITD